MKLRILALASVLSLGPTACQSVTPQQMSDTITKLQQVSDQVAANVVTTKAQMATLQSQIAAQQAVAATQPADSAAAKTLADQQAMLAKFQAAMDKSLAWQATADATLAAMQKAATQPAANPLGVVGAGVAAAAPAAGPYAGYVALAGMLLTTIGSIAVAVVQTNGKNAANAKADQATAQGNAIVSSLEVGKATNPALKTALEASAPIIKAVQQQTPGTEDQVNAVQATIKAAA